MGNNCGCCLHKPKWEKQHDDLHIGFCKKLGRNVWMGTASHGQGNEWFEIEHCEAFDLTPANHGGLPPSAPSARTG